MTGSEATEDSPWCPSPGPPVAAPFAPLGPPRRVPQLQRYYGAVRLPVPLSPRFVAFAWRYPAVCLGFAPNGSGHQTAGLGFIFRSPLPDIAAGRQPGPPRFPDNPLSLCPVLRPRQDRTHQASTMCRHGPRYDHNEGSHEIPAFEAQSHGFRTRCLRFVPCVATRDAKLASGRWPSATGRACLPAGLLRKVSDVTHPPFPSFPGARPLRANKRLQ